MELAKVQECPEHLWQDDSFKPNVMAVLYMDYQRTKAEYFPDYPHSYEFRDGGVTWKTVLKRHDEELVPEEVYDAYAAWKYQEDDENISFDFGTEYHEDYIFYRQVAWYANVPDKFVIKKVTA